MKSKNVKMQPAKVLAKVSLKLSRMSADSACCYIYHQPKMPEALKTIKNAK
ncbi:MAG: cyclic lactone autoinducer peptide [Lachnospiraceae bacterium]